MKTITVILIAIMFASCGHDTRTTTICTCEQLEKVGQFVSENVQKANNMSDEEMEDVISELRNTGIKLNCSQRLMKYEKGESTPDWEIEKLDSCETYHFTYVK